MIYPVDNFDDAYNACNPDQPLDANDARYLDLTAVRNGENISILAKRITRAEKEDGLFHKQLFTGHRGSGKSTELHLLKQQLQDKRYFVVFLDVEKSLDLGEITYQDVLLSIAKSTLETLNKNNISINPALLDDLEKWFADKIVSQDYVKEVKASAKVSAKAGISIPFITELLAKIEGEMRSGSSYKTEIRQTIEKELSVFIAKLNDLLLAARVQLQRDNYVDLVIIVDGLEKMTHRILPDNESNHTHLFIRHAEQLNAPQAHIIYTVPISLIFNAALGNEFADNVFMIPMVKYQEDKGKEQLIELVAHRMKLELFESNAILTQLIDMSGGSMRDLLRLIRLATETAAVQIKSSDIERAINILVKDYSRLLKEDYFPLLKQIQASQNIIADKERIYEQLLHFRLVHEYENGKRWADLHPALKKIDWLQAKLDAA